MNLLNVPNDTLTGRLLRMPLRLIPQNAVVTVRGGLNKGMKWIVGSSIHGCWLGTYERIEQEVVRSLVKPDMVVYDIGANAGFYSLGFSRLARQVFAFEPMSQNVTNLLRHVKLNGRTNITVVQTALSDRDSLSGFDMSDHNSVGHLCERSHYIVPTATLDRLIESGIPSPDFVKMDAEGAEVAILNGARALLAARRTLWLVSLHAHGITELFEREGYVVTPVGATDIIAAPSRSSSPPEASRPSRPTWTGQKGGSPDAV